jgi:hypothetical protein
VFEKKDFITFFLLARHGAGVRRAVLGLCGGLKRRGSAGRWRRGGADRRAIAFEHNRSNCSIQMALQRQYSGLIMLLIRIVLAEQNTGVIGWLQYVGLQNEQMTNLAWSIFAGICAGLSPAV